MAKSANVKLRILYVMDYLQKNSTESNPIATSELIEMLREKGIEAERKTIYDDIYSLNEFGFDIIKTAAPKRGWFLASREFEDAEIYLLADAVGNADFITPKKTRQLTEKLYSMIGASKDSDVRKPGIMSLRKCDNESIYYHIDCLETAIAAKKQVEICYSHRVLNDRKILTQNKKFTLSPYAMIWKDDHYYLIANNSKYDNFMHLRIDKISSVKITEIPVRDFHEIMDLGDHFDLAKYSQSAFNMFSGEHAKIELKCRTELLDTIIDRFTDKIYIRDSSNGWFAFSCDAFISEGLIAWILQFRDSVEILKPDSLREKINNYIKDMFLLYNS